MERLSKYPGTETATKHLAQEKAGQSILSIMGSYTQCFEYLKNSYGDFSIKKWASSDEDKRCVFLGALVAGLIRGCCLMPSEFLNMSNLVMLAKLSGFTFRRIPSKNPYSKKSSFKFEPTGFEYCHFTILLD
jgi:hypothetical protein